MGRGPEAHKRPEKAPRLENAKKLPRSAQKAQKRRGQKRLKKGSEPTKSPEKVPRPEKAEKRPRSPQKAQKRPRDQKRLGRGAEAHKRPRKGPEARKGWEDAQKKTHKRPRGQKRLGRAHKRPRKGRETRKGWEEAQKPTKGPEEAPRPEKAGKRHQKAQKSQQLALRRGWQKYFQPSSDAQANPSSKKPETQPLRKAPQPTSKKLVWDKLKPETFGQNFRSKLSVKTQGPKPYTISINPHHIGTLDSLGYSSLPVFVGPPLGFLVRLGECKASA